MRHEQLALAVGNVDLPGELDGPRDAAGLVVFVHGSGSSRHSPRNRWVAEQLQAQGFLTLRFDLLTPQEDLRYEARFDLELLTERLLRVTKTMRRTVGLPLAYFGASTGAAAALRAAAELPEGIAAIVSRGGRPDLAGAALARVQVPTLLIVGSKDRGVLELNREALRQLGAESRLEVVPGAGHLFEEPGALPEVARIAADWFSQYCGASRMA